MRLFEGTPFDIPPQCTHCGLLERECKCPPKVKARIAPNQQTASVSLEKRKKGKTVTVVTGLTAVANDLPDLLSKLKNACGAGGTANQDTIEVQGDHVFRIRSLLAEIGYRVQGGRQG
jgi:translation initiation factor 1